MFQRGVLAQMKQQAELQADHLRVMNERITELRGEKEKLEELEAERDRGTAKGRSYEESVFDAIASIARGARRRRRGGRRHPRRGRPQGRRRRRDRRLLGPARGQIVFEAKDRRLSRNEALAELDGCLATRSASYAVLVVPSEDELPARTHANTEFNANKVFCVYDPEDGSTLSLEVAYTLARARVLMARDDADGLDAVALRTEVERAIQALEEVRKIKVQLTNASTGIENAHKLVGTMADSVRGPPRAGQRADRRRGARGRVVAVARRAVVHGRVQGVFFRDTVRRAAQQRGVAGWAANRPDGTVEVWLEGEQDAVDSMLRVLHDGPPRAEVERVDVDEVEPQGLERASRRASGSSRG